MAQTRFTLHTIKCLIFLDSQVSDSFKSLPHISYSCHNLERSWRSRGNRAVLEICFRNQGSRSCWSYGPPPEEYRGSGIPRIAPSTCEGLMWGWGWGVDTRSLGADPGGASFLLCLSLRATRLLTLGAPGGTCRDLPWSRSTWVP